MYEATLKHWNKGKARYIQVIYMKQVIGKAKCIIDYKCIKENIYLAQQFAESLVCINEGNE